MKSGGFTLEDLGADADETARRIREEFGFTSGRSTHADRVATIQETHKRYGALIDPHTADGVFVARGVAASDTPIVVLETALPVKFADTIVEAIGAAPEIPDRFAGIMDAGRHVADLPNDAGRVKEFIIDAIENTDV